MATNASPGNWLLQTVNGMQYMVLLPAGYDPGTQYSTTLYLHQNDNGSFGAQALQDQINSWFNTGAFRSDYQTIVVAPLLNEAADMSGATINWGGWSASDSVGETNAIAALKQVLGEYSTDPTRVYVTGNSLGGIGAEDMLIKFNAYTGAEGKIFAAGLALAGADYGQGFPVPNPSVVTALRNVPFWAIHGGQDDQVPINFDQNLYAAEQAIGGDMKFTQDNSLGHDVWDTYYTQTGNGSPFGWLYGQSTGGSASNVSSAASIQSNVSAASSSTSTISLYVSEDTYQGDAQFTASVDGQQVGGTMTASALHDSGDDNVFVLTGNWSTGAHQVKIQFTNDAYGGSASADRNLYVDGIALNGVVQSNTSAAIAAAAGDTFTVGATGSAASPADTLTLHLAEDAWNGNARFELFIDGKQVTTAQDVTASHASGAWQDVTFAGNFGAGSHTVGVAYTNDAWGGSAGADRNLYINGVDVNGQHYGNGETAMMSGGTTNFTITAAH